MLLVSISVLASSCRKTDIRPVVIRVPGMINQQCADIVVNALSRARYGVKVKSIETDLATRTIMLNYDSMLLSLKNVEFIIADAGFQANEVPANKTAEAALPDKCRQ